MCQRFAILVVVGALGNTIGVLTNSLFGQMVDVSPNSGLHVRAPYTCVDIDDCGVSVRAPFVSIHVPIGHRHFHRDPTPAEGPVIEIPGQPSGQSPGELPPPTPTPQQLNKLRDESLRQLLHANAARLRSDLRRFDTGDKWQRYLHVSNDEPEALASDAERFRKIAANSQFGMIAELPSFRATHSVLTELASRPGGSTIATSTRPEELPRPRLARQTAERSMLP